MWQGERKIALNTPFVEELRKKLANQKNSMTKKKEKW